MRMGRVSHRAGESPWIAAARGESLQRREYPGSCACGHDHPIGGGDAAAGAPLQDRRLHHHQPSGSKHGQLPSATARLGLDRPLLLHRHGGFGRLRADGLADPGGQSAQQRDRGRRQGNMLDWGFLVDPAKAKDHIDRAAHVTAVATQQITKRYYKTQKLYRYFSGCSGGGRMATMAIERHPEDFDGVLLGAPGGRSNATMLAFIYNAQQMNREPGAWLSPAKLQMLDKKVTEQCDALDGAKDGIIWDHTACKVDFDQFKCAGGDQAECLTEPELKSVKAIVAGPQGPNGPIKVGYPVSNISVWSGFLGATPPPWSDDTSMENMAKTSPGYVIGSSVAEVFFGPNFNALTDFNFSDQKQLDAG